MKKPKMKATENTAEKVETTRQKLLAKYGDLQLQREAHVAHIQNIEKEMMNIKISMSKLKG